MKLGILRKPKVLVWATLIVFFLLLSILLEQIYYLHFGTQVIVKQIANPNSGLFKILNCDEVVVLPRIDWHWYSTGEFQDYENDYEYVSCSFAGYFHSGLFRRADAFLDYSLIKSDNEISITQDSALIDDFHGNQVVLLTLKKFGKVTYYSCVQNEKQFSCLIAVQYDPHTKLNLRFTGGNEIDRSSVEYLVNTLLTKIDSAINYFDP